MRVQDDILEPDKPVNLDCKCRAVTAGVGPGVCDGVSRQVNAEYLNFPMACFARACPEQPTPEFPTKGGHVYVHTSRTMEEQKAMQAFVEHMLRYTVNLVRVAPNQWPVANSRLTLSALGNEEVKLPVLQRGTE
jgi:hypothetical protein